MKPIKLYQSLFILQKCNRVINRIISRMRDIKNGEIVIKVTDDDAIDFGYHLLLEVTSFMEEYNGEFNTVEKQYKNRVVEIRRICVPIVKQINKWKDIQTFRSRIIAHNWRDKQGNFVIPDTQIYNIPRNWFEFQVLSDLMKYLYTMIHLEFKYEMSDALKYMETLIPSERTPADYSQLNSEINQMVVDVNIHCHQLSKSYRLKVNQYIIPGYEEQDNFTKNIE